MPEKSNIALCRDPAELYLNVLKRVLVRWDEDKFVPMTNKGWLRPLVKRACAARGLSIWQVKPFDAEARTFGRDWPDGATIIGAKRIENIQFCIKTVLQDGVPGDLVEAGLWRGGASIFMRAALEAFGDADRVVWCADSFKGWPVPNARKYPRDKNSVRHLQSHRALSLAMVKDNFRKHSLLDDRVKFLAGWFEDTLPTAPIGEIAVLRLDGDMYGSTMDVLTALYAKVSPGGFVIMNDYANPGSDSRPAIDDFRRDHGINEPIADIDGCGAYWRRLR